jgi:hypothetical protein
LQRCIEEYREPISFTVLDSVPLPQTLATKLRLLVESRATFMEGAQPAMAAAVAAVVSKVEQVAAVAAVADTGKGLNSEVVHENEQEEEAEEEAEEEEQKQSAFSREDEQHNPWPTELLTRSPPASLTDQSPFYALAEYCSREERPRLPFPRTLLLTDNFFRPPERWAGVGERRLKNVIFLLEWVPPVDVDAAAAAAAAAAASADSGSPRRYLLTMSLAEGETLRRLIHTEPSLLHGTGLGTVCSVVQRVAATACPHT